MGANTPVLSMKTKCSLVLVCRAWRETATELLYEYLVIRSLRRAVQVLSALRSSPRSIVINGVEVTISEYGQCVKHIEIHAQARAVGSNKFAENLFRIFQLCPNIRVLSGVWGGAIPRWLSAAMPRFYGPKLQLLRWDSLSYAMSSTDICTLTPEHLTAFQSLRTLDLRKFGGWPSADYGKPDLTLHRVSHLVLTTNEPSLRTATNLVLPSLSHVILAVPFFHPMPTHFWNFTGSSGMYTPVADKEHVRAFLAAHGAKITSLEFISSPMYVSSDERNSESHSNTVSPSHRLNMACFLLPGVCPNLLDLVFNAHEHVIDMKLLTEPHNSLRRIGLRGVSETAMTAVTSSQALNHLYAFRRNLERFPALEVIRTLDFHAGAVEKYNLHIFIYWTEWFKKRGVDLEDGEGVIWLWDEYEDSRQQTPQKEVENLYLADGPSESK